MREVGVWMLGLWALGFGLWALGLDVRSCLLNSSWKCNELRLCDMSSKLLTLLGIVRFQRKGADSSF